jgi:hypothetical protein
MIKLLKSKFVHHSMDQENASSIFTDNTPNFPLWDLSSLYLYLLGSYHLSKFPPCAPFGPCMNVKGIKASKKFHGAGILGVVHPSLFFLTHLLFHMIKIIYYL